MLKFKSLILVLLLALLSPSLMAKVKSSNGAPSVGASSENSSPPRMSLDSDLIRKDRSEVEGYFRLEAASYPTQIPGSPQLSQSLLSTLNLKLKDRSGAMLSEADFTVGKFLDLGPSTIAVPQLYTSIFWSNSQTQTSFGRKFEFWSELDEQWQLGLWQPKFNLDGLRPEDQGLTGFFVKHDFGDWEALGYLSPIFIPTMSPEIKEKDGSLVADNRWYRSPSSSFPLFGRDTQLVYDLDIPNIAELIAKPGGGIRLRSGHRRMGPWISGNFAYKPINSLLLKYKSNLYLPETDPATGEVTISPAVGYHNLWGLDLGHREETRNWSLSYLEDRPELRFPSGNWVQQSPLSLRAFGAHMDQILRLPGFRQDSVLSLDYLRVLGAGIKDYDSLGQEQGAIFDTRVNFSHAASIKLNTQSVFLGKSLLGSVRYLREFDQKGTLINAEAVIYPQKKLAVVMGFDILGTDDPDNEEDTGFLNQFRANDRVYGGMTYVF